MLKPWNIFDGSVELLTTAPLVVVVVVIFVDRGLDAPPNIDGASVLALAKLNPIEELDDNAAGVAVVVDVDRGVDSAMANGDATEAGASACPIGEAPNLDVISDTGCT